MPQPQQTLKSQLLSLLVSVLGILLLLAVYHVCYNAGSNKADQENRAKLQQKQATQNTTGIQMKGWTP
jgi:cbb3-type cytochrome oxidase subunit 3